MAVLAGNAHAQNVNVQPRLADGQIAVQNLKVDKNSNTIVLDMTLRLDSLHMAPNRRMVFTPVVEGQGNRLNMPSVVVNGRKQQISYLRHGYKNYEKNAINVRRKNGTAQSVHYSGVLPYEAWMANSNIVISEDLCGCGDVLDNKSNVVRRLRTPYVAFIHPQAEGQKERCEEGRAFLDFPVNKIELYPEYRNNPRELDKIIQTINLVKEDKNATITSISIHGYASPEDTYQHNTYLAENRARTLKDYVRNLLSLDDRIFQVKSTPEDWDGLRQYVAESNLPNKEGILAIIDDKGLEPDPKEWRIKLRYPEDYKYLLDNCYPALRHSDYVVNYHIRPFSVEEAKELLHTKPQQLSLEEMYLVAQTYKPGSKEFNEVFEIAVRLYPDDLTANLNAACTRIVNEDYDGAARYLDKAGQSAAAIHARGIVAMMRGDTKQARSLFEEARRMGLPEAEKNLELLDFE